jgi:hypothetical protein
MNKILKIKIIILISVGIFFTLFPIIQNNLNFIIGETESINISYNNKNLKISQGEVLYSENFDDGIADYWKTIGGTWVVENNAYKATGTPGERVRSYYVKQSFAYYIYEGDFNLVSGQLYLIQKYLPL